uniref:non-specific serine/threonine protein kinase n=1 Tax=Macrostomum lignano TaxID=282301 RepID=A0A1I8FIE5_9PLAT
SNKANKVSASSSCPQSIVKSLSPLSLNEFEIVSSAASDIVDKLPNCHDNVRLIRRKSDGKLLVWKRIHYGSMDEQELKMLLSELMVVRQIQYVGRIVDEVKQDVYIVSEYCANGDLTGRVKAVLHRDLKPANCFLDSDGNLKLGDFGLARVLRHSGSFASTFVGTPYYMSPEQMQKSAYTEKSTSGLWALPPFVADKQRDLATRIRRGEFEPPPDWYSFSLFNLYSPALRTLISDCLSVNPDHRPTVEDLLRRPEMRNRLSANESTPEASLRHWSDQLRELTDLLTAWQDSLTRQEVELRRQEASLASAAAARQMELEKREARLDRLAKQLDERTKQLTELQDWLRHSGFTPPLPLVLRGSATSLLVGHSL